MQTLDRLCFSLRGIYILKEIGQSKFFGVSNPLFTFKVRSKVVDCFRRKKTVFIGNIRSKIKGAAIVEPTKDELIEILNTFATVDSEENWVFHLNKINNRQFVNFQWNKEYKYIFFGSLITKIDPGNRLEISIHWPGLGRLRQNSIHEL